MFRIPLRLIFAGMILCTTQNPIASAQHFAPEAQVDSDDSEANVVPRGLTSSTEKLQVEIAPKKWVTVLKTDLSYDEELSLTIPQNELPSERTRLNIPWRDNQVVWDTVSIPFSLRVFDDVLHIIAFDRETDFSKPRFRYYRQDGAKFKEIKPDEFPREIATQNMWLKPTAVVRGSDDKLHYDLQLARDINPDDVYFYSTLTARVWVHLATGKDYYQQDHHADGETVKSYKRMYSPVPIPTIIKTPPGWPSDK
jgi:hypothetical protein